MIPDDSALSHKIKKMIDKEAAKQNHSLIPLHEENGVYNFYVRAKVEGGKVEVVSDAANQQQDGVKALSKDALEKRVIKLRRATGKGSSAFPLQLGA